VERRRREIHVRQGRQEFYGAPYKYGGNTVRGLDCSAYVKKIYEIFDVQLPEAAREQFLVGSKIGKEKFGWRSCIL
jgi:cell wall-associated NlpC family hydrolase